MSHGASRHSLWVTGIVALVMSLAGCKGKSSSAGGATGGAAAPAAIVLKFSHTDQPGGTRHRAAEMFAKRVAEYTQGRYKVQVYPAGQLGNDPKAVEQLQLGGVDFTVSSTGTYGTHVPPLNLLLMPYLVDTYEQGWKLYDESKWVKQQFESTPAKGFRIIATWEAGFRDLTTKTAVNAPADIKGMKLRSFSNEMMRWTLEAMGFSIQVLPLPEVYLAIQQGVVAGQENPIDTTFSNKFYEVAPYVTLTRHVYSPIPLTIAEKTWAKMSEQDRAVVTKAGLEVGAWIRSEVRNNDEKQLAEMKTKGAKILRPDIEPFRLVAKRAYVNAQEKYGQDAANLLSEAANIRQAVPSK